MQPREPTPCLVKRKSLDGSSPVSPAKKKRKPQPGLIPDWGFLTHYDACSSGTSWSLQRPVSLLQLQGKPRGERLHAVTFNVVAVPDREGDWYRRT